MADALSIIDTAYAGEAASYFITRPVVGMDTTQKGCIHVQDGIKKQYTIPRIEVADFVQKRQATPVSKGAITVDGRVLIPRDLMIYIEFNPRDYEAHWQAVNLEPKLLDRELPPTAEDFTMLQTMKKLNQFFELHTWRGRISFDPDAASPVTPASVGQVASDAIYFYFDGLIYKLLSDANTIKVTTPLTLVSGTAGAGEENILDAFQRVYNKVPEAILFQYGAKGLKFHVNYGTQQIYEQALTTQAYKNNDTTEKGINRYKGYDVVPLAGLTANTIVACVSAPGTDSNLWLGVNSVEDQDTLTLAKLQANSEFYFIKGLMKMDTQIGFTDFVVLYTTITA